MQLSAQEHLIPGATLLHQWAAVSQLGYAGIELRGGGDTGFTDRLPELREAVRGGVQLSSICGILPGVYVGSLDAAARRDAIGRLKVLLSAAGELGIPGVISPAAYAIYPIPRNGWVRTDEQDHQILLDGFGELAEHAKRSGTQIWIEPLNRYEDHMLNRLEQAVVLCEAIGLDSVGVMADLFHMHVEEANSAAALKNAKGWLRHLHGADSTRAEPGSGQMDYPAIKAALRDIEFDGAIALECRLSLSPLESLRRAARTLS